MKIRASIGTATALNLEQIKAQCVPTTAYLMLYSDSHCFSNCKFCPQARDSLGNINQLSRVLWPVYNLDDIITNLKTNTFIKRVCIQTVRFDNTIENLLETLKVFSRNKIKKPISICACPLPKNELQKVKSLGVTRIGISFDCATPEIFAGVKGGIEEKDLTWNQLEVAINDACEIFGNRFVSTHLIIGLGETEEEAVKFIQKFYEKKITVGLFAFTPIKGTKFENISQPPLDKYRRIQLARYLICSGKTSFNEMIFSREVKEKGKIIGYGISNTLIKKAINSGKPFQTSGCSFCNRPFYNESPRKELYNYPRKLTKEEREKCRNAFLII